MLGASECTCELSILAGSAMGRLLSLSVLTVGCSQPVSDSCSSPMLEGGRFLGRLWSVCMKPRTFLFPIILATGVATWSQSSSPGQSQQAAGAQQPPSGAQQHGPAQGTAASVGLFAYPRNNQ